MRNARVFEDRTEAGRRLADALAGRKFDNPLVLALPRGGVPVAAEVARRLGAPLELILVRKIGVPGQPELAAAAVVDGAEAQLVVNDDIVAAEHVTDTWLREESRRQLALIEQRRARYLGGHPQVSARGRTAIVVDDGIATGATARAALAGLRRQHPARIIVAVPVASPEAIAMLEREADEVIALEAPASLGAIGFYYRDFTQVEDAEVCRILDAARSATS